MKVVAAIIIACLAVGVLVIAYFTGLWIGMAKNYNNRLRDLGLNKTSAVLYVRASKILLRLQQRTDMDGLAAGDRLSPETQHLVDKWATDFRIGASK